MKIYYSSAPSSGGASTTVDTKANILATASPSSGDLAFATDTKRFYIYDGTNWNECAIVFSPSSSTPNIGTENDYSLVGYNDFYITDKLITQSVIGWSDRTDIGGVRINLGGEKPELEFYLNADVGWQPVIVDFTIEDGDLRHVPVGDEVYVYSGDSVSTGPNGQPTMGQYGTSIGEGAFMIISGGELI